MPDSARRWLEAGVLRLRGTGECVAGPNAMLDVARIEREGLDVA